MSPVPPNPLRVLVVCTANICRSPMAAAMLAAACAANDLDVEVSSAGFLFDGRAASDTTGKVMHELGHDLGSHRSRVLSAPIVAGADLVLTMERRHARELLLDLAPAAPVHTLKGFAALASAGASDDALVGAAAGDLRAFVLALEELRPPHALVGDGRPDEVADPHGRSARVHRKAADEIRGAIEAIVAAFAKVRASS